MGPLDVYWRDIDDGQLATAEAAFFSALQLPNGTFKTTVARRLDDVNEALLPFLPRGRLIQLMDVAVSSGISTIEWAEQLRRNAIEYEITAGDLMPTGSLLTLGQRVAVLWDPAGQPLCLQIGERTVYLSRSRNATYARVPFELLYAAVSRLRRGPHHARPARYRIMFRSVSLVSHAILREVTIDVIKDDIEQAGSVPKRFDVCRAANILNREYFTDDRLRAMLANLLARVREGGILVLCRTDESSQNRTTIVRRQGDNAEVIARLNGGCDIEYLLDPQAATISSGSMS